VAASSQCLQCVGSTDTKPLNTANTPLTETECAHSSRCAKAAGICWGRFNGGCTTYCKQLICPLGGRRLTDVTSYEELAARRLQDSTETPTHISFQIDVCMDDITPLDSSSSSYYEDYTAMINDFTSQLTECYAQTEDFYNSWSSLCAESGVDLSLATSTRDPTFLRTPVLLSEPFVNIENAKVISYSSSDSHRSTANVLLYAGVGIAAVSAFAVVGAVVVVNLLKKRAEAEDEKALNWIAGMNSIEPTSTDSRY